MFGGESKWQSRVRLCKYSKHFMAKSWAHKQKFWKSVSTKPPVRIAHLEQVEGKRFYENLCKYLESSAKRKKGDSIYRYKHGVVRSNLFVQCFFVCHMQTRKEFQNRKIEKLIFDSRKNRQTRMWGMLLTAGPRDRNKFGVSKTITQITLLWPQESRVSSH